MLVPFKIIFEMSPLGGGVEFYFEIKDLDFNCVASNQVAEDR